MRRKVGVSAVRRNNKEAAAYSSLGKSLEDSKLASVKGVLGSFKDNLTEFGKKHRDRINSDPEFRHQFHTMCLSVGVDPLASNKGFWSDILGLGDFYFELGIKIIRITVRTRSENGGIMLLSELVQELQKTSTAADERVSADDVVRSIDKLSVLGCGFKLINAAKGKNPLVVSVPLEVSADHEYILSAAQDSAGLFTESQVRGEHGWSKERFDMIMSPLLHEGVVWVDRSEGQAEDTYFFFSIWKDFQSSSNRDS